MIFTITEITNFFLQTTMWGLKSNLATAKSALTNFSPSPTHFDVKLDAEMLKKFVFCISSAKAFAKRVFPLPGGPYNNKPLKMVRILEVKVHDLFDPQAVGT